MCLLSVLLKLTVFMMTSPLLYRYDSPLFCVALPGTDFIAQMLPLLTIVFEAAVTAVVRFAQHLKLVFVDLLLENCQVIRSHISLDQAGTRVGCCGFVL